MNAEASEQSLHVGSHFFRDRETGRQTCRQTGRADRQANMQADRQAEKRVILHVVACTLVSKQRCCVAGVTRQCDSHARQTLEPDWRPPETL
ncbi:hypothetical protein PoB_000776300 [Plakobranchus ocellatus]|uniref:Uncharacterized protein n=1 Tax=Plakobranchus ocellatus TaxID=259542 RepID=A0AAV3YFK7_9GAST|nr:hypothetical protein PoB_000776300 [Plakobranchus ocellatus]